MQYTTVIILYSNPEGSNITQPVRNVTNFDTLTDISNGSRAGISSLDSTWDNDSSPAPQYNQILTY